MKILLVMGVKYLPARGGAQKYNRTLMEALAQRGHTCRVVAQCLSAPEISVHTKFLAAEGIEAHLTPEVDVYPWGGVEVHTLKVSTRVREYLAEQLREFEPTWVIVSEDWTDLLAEVWPSGPERIVYLVQSSANIPFGPLSFMPNPLKARRFRQVAGVMTVSRYLRDYIHQWSGQEAEIIPFMAYGAGPFQNYGNNAQPGFPLIPGMGVPGHDGRAAHGYVTLINPAAIKGLPIFLELARRLPEVAFAAVPTWGTTAVDRAALEALPNVTLLAAQDEVDAIYAQTRVLLVPSLWDEAFGVVAVEAMLRGIPVLASQVGGLPEAKLGVPYVLPVSPIERYQAEVDERGVPVPVVPVQEVEPWVAALQALLSVPGRYAEVSQASRAAAHQFVGALDLGQSERYLADLAAQPTSPTAETISEADPAWTRLSDERRRLLVRRLRRQSQVDESVRS